MEKSKIYKLARKLLFIFPPEISQSLSHVFLKIFSWAYRKESTSFDIKGLKVKNRLGLAAGLDKNGEFVKEFDNIGFGFIEIGTVTPEPQAGNPKPRIHRLAEHDSLVNSLGFPNQGMKRISSRLQGLSDDICLGINIGPNKNNATENPINDYLECYKNLYEYADFVTLNISSPNTPNLRKLHSVAVLSEIVSAILEERNKYEYRPKILLKISPDEQINTYEKLVNIINSTEIDGVIVTNTTNSEALKKRANAEHLPGGISGRLLNESSNKILKEIKSIINTEKIIVAVGGVYDVDSYNEKIDLGADLVQMYTGLIYEGPNLVKRIIKNGKQISSNS
mgnify:FL=1